MSRDFTIRVYSNLLEALGVAGYQFQTLSEYLKAPLKRVVILRHDVDSWPANARKMAKIEARHNAKATYYFRKSQLSFNEKVLKSIIKLGHEIGYHYEDLASCNGDIETAIKRFQKNLEFFRQFYPVSTIAMHGRPLSKWDSKDLWKHYNYHEFGLLAEPYLDIDFNKVAYLTDTGNCWDGDKYSVRDHVKTPFKFDIHSTKDLLASIEQGKMPDQMMLNIHPARWNDNLVKWLVRYYVLTLPKYQAKKWLKRIREK